MKITTHIDTDLIPVTMTLPVRDLIDLSIFLQDEEIKNRLEKVDHYFVKQFAQQLQKETIKVSDKVGAIR